MKNEILRMLKNSKDEFLSGEKISDEFGVTRSAIWKNMNSLKELGYDIESVPRKGYRIIYSPDILTYEEIESGLNTEYIGRQVFYFDTISSTNIKAKEIALEEPEGTVVISEEQTGGIGRLGRTWVSPKKKGIWMSIILKPEVEPMKVSKIALVGAAAVNRALSDIGIKSGIKWPNDIVIDGKKVCGILTEMSCELNMINYVVMGIGINVNLDNVDIPDDLQYKATSLKIVENKEINRKRLLASILNHFEQLYKDFKDDGNITKVLQICRDNSVLLGEEVRIIRGKDLRIGKALDLNDEGQLIVQFENGTVENIFSGEVSVRGINGYI